MEVSAKCGRKWTAGIICMTILWYCLLELAYHRHKLITIYYTVPVEFPKVLINKLIIAVIMNARFPSDEQMHNTI